MTIEVALLISLVTAALSVVSALSHLRKNYRSAGIKEGIQTATLEHIKLRVDEVWAGQKTINDKVEALDRRLIAAEEKLKTM